MSNKNSVYYIENKSYLPIEEIIPILRKAGGKIFLAHLFVYSLNYVDAIEYLKVNNLVDGLECYHSSFTKNQTDYLVNFCSLNNLLMSGGSDFHGDKKPNVYIGLGNSNLNISNDVISNWVKLYN